MMVVKSLPYRFQLLDYFYRAPLGRTPAEDLELMSTIKQKNKNLYGNESYKERGKIKKQYNS
jgi:hypothetical protein